MIMAAVFKSRSTDERETPDDFFQKLNGVFHFTIDLAASHKIHKCPVYFTKETDALSRTLFGRGFLNPPFSNLTPWVRWCQHEGLGPYKPLIVALLPRRRDAKWYREFCGPPALTVLIPRLKFAGFDTVPKFDLMLVVWNATRAQIDHLYEVLNLEPSEWTMVWRRRKVRRRDAA